MIAFVFFVITFLIFSAVIKKLFRSTSANTGTAFACKTAIAVLLIVNGGHITSSPAFTPAASNAICNVAVPFTIATACFAPNFFANSFSNRVTILYVLDDENCPFNTSSTYFLSKSLTLSISNIKIASFLNSLSYTQ